MTATIGSFISALTSPKTSLLTLHDAIPTFGEDGRVEICRTKYFAETIIEWNSKRYILAMPLSSEAEEMAQLSAIKLKLAPSSHILDYRLLPRELSYYSHGKLHFASLVLHEIPHGVMLGDLALQDPDPQEVFEAVDALECELQRVGLIHCNLRAENIIVDSNMHLYPTRCHYLDVYDSESADIYFQQLRLELSLLLGVECEEIPVAFVTSPSPMASVALRGYDMVGNLFEGLRVVSRDSLYGYIDHLGVEVIPRRFLWASDFREGRAEVETTEGMGLIDSAGHFVIPSCYRVVTFDSRTTLSFVKDGELWAEFDYEGRQVSPFRERWW